MTDPGVDATTFCQKAGPRRHTRVPQTRFSCFRQPWYIKPASKTCYVRPSFPRGLLGVNRGMTRTKRWRVIGCREHFVFQEPNHPLPTHFLSVLLARQQRLLVSTVLDVRLLEERVGGEGRRGQGERPVRGVQVEPPGIRVPGVRELGPAPATAAPAPPAPDVQTEYHTP